MQNKTSTEFTSKRKRAGLINALKSGKLYEEYLKHPTAQYKMTFSEYKRNRKKIISDGDALGFDRAKSTEVDNSVNDHRSKNLN